jgi:polar amino acid transport system substrate-binding protein
MSALVLALLLVAGVQNDGPLVVAADVGFAPHAMARPDGTTEGFNVDLAEAIAKRLGRPGLRVVDSEWSGIFAGLEAGKYELIAAPTTVTPERARMVLFAEGYLDTDFTFLVKKEAPDVTALSDLTGKAIAVNNGSAYDVWATENASKYGLTVQRYGKNADAIQAVLSGRAFANLAGSSVAAWAAKRNPRVKLSYTLHTGTTFALAFRKTDVSFRNRVDEILECLKLDGTVARLHEKWFGEAPKEGSAAVTVRPGFGEPGVEGHDPTPHEPRCSP